MEQINKASEEVKDLYESYSSVNHSPAETGVATIHRESESVDDFEHLEHEILPTKEIIKEVDNKTSGDFVPGFMEQQPRATVDDAPVLLINTSAAVKSARDAASKLEDYVSSVTADVKEVIGDTIVSFDNKPSFKMETASELIDIGGSFKPTDFYSENKSSDSHLSDLSYVPPVPPHAVPLGETPVKEKDPLDSLLNETKTASQNFMDIEREGITLEPAKVSTFNDLADKFSDSDPELDIDDYKHSVSDELRSDSPTVDINRPVSVDTFKDVINEDIKSVSPILDKKEPSPEKELPKYVPTAPPVEVPTKPVTPEPIKEKSLFEDSNILHAPKSSAKRTEVGIIQAEEMFCKMGLDTWFNPERLHPKVEALVYWRDPKKSGAVFGGILLILLSLSYFSLISVIAYISLLALVAAIAFRIYKNVLQAVQKTSDGHPFKEFLEMDLTLPQDKVKEVTEIVVAHINGAVNELRRLFLVEDLVDSIKFGVLLWCLTYLGAWFNGMTLIIIAFVALFTLPKVYETNKTQIDANIDIVRTKVAEITSKVKAAIPIGKKAEEKKEQ